MTPTTPGLTWEEAKAQDPNAFRQSQQRGGYERARMRRAAEPAWLTCDAADFERWLQQQEAQRHAVCDL